jgi:hypothetical protein
MGPVIATGRPSLAALPGHRVGPWAVDYADHGIGTAGLGIGNTGHETDSS